MRGIDATAVSNAMEGFGAALVGVGDKFGKIAERQEAEERIMAFARADADLVTRQPEFEEQVKRNPDYNTWGDAYKANAPALLQQSAQLIENPRHRELWMARRQTNVAQGLARIGEEAQRRNKDHYLAEAGTTLETLDRTFQTATDEATRTETVTAAQNIIRDLVLRGVIKESVGADMGRRWVEGASVGSLATLPPAERVAVLGGNVTALRQMESGGIPSKVNQLGYAGLYQYGAPRLAYLGVYQPGVHEDLGTWSKTPSTTPGKWSGTLNIPGFPDVKTIKDFLATPAAQEAVFQLDDKKKDQEIQSAGFDKYIGQTVGGVVMTRESIKNMIHLGGVEGTRIALESDGRITSRDLNGKSVMDYARLGQTSGRAVQLAAFLPPDKRAILLDRAEAEYREEQRRFSAGMQNERAQIGLLRKDDITSIEATGQGLAPEVLNRDRILAVSGDIGALDWENDRARARRVFEVVDGARTMPRQAIEARLQAIEPRPGTEGYADDLAAYTKAQRAVASILDARDKDPALAAEAMPFVQSARQSAAQAAEQNPANAPAGAQSVISARLAAQEQMMMPPAKRRVLSNAEVSAMASEITAGPADEVNVAGKLDAWQKIYGPHWPRVYGELVQHGKIPGPYQVLASMTEPSQIPARIALQRGLTIMAQKGGLQQMRAALPDNTSTDADKAIDSALGDFREVAGAVQAGQLFNSVETAARVLAYQDIMNGASPRTAGKNAVHAILDARWDFSGTIMAPKGKLPDVIRATREMTSALKPEDLAPGVMTAMSSNMTAEQRQQGWLRAARSGRWVMNDRLNGVVLMVVMPPYGQRPVQRVDGSRIEVLFDDVKPPPERPGFGMSIFENLVPVAP
jgi:hypothetical protein